MAAQYSQRNDSLSINYRNGPFHAEWPYQPSQELWPKPLSLPVVWPPLHSAQPEVLLPAYLLT